MLVSPACLSHHTRMGRYSASVVLWTIALSIPFAGAAFRLIFRAGPQTRYQILAFVLVTAGVEVYARHSRRPYSVGRFMVSAGLTTLAIIGAKIAHEGDGILLQPLEYYVPGVSYTDVAIAVSAGQV